MPSSYEVIRIVSLYLCLTLAAQTAHSAGGAVFSALSFVAVRPTIRWLVATIDFIFSARIFVLFKLIGWAIASAGILFGYYAFTLFFRGAMNKYEYWVCLLVSAGYISRIISIMLFEQLRADLDKAIIGMKYGMRRTWSIGNARITHADLKRNLRATFLDMCVPVLLQLVVTFSLFCFAASRLGMMETVNGSQPEPFTCLLSIVGLINIGTSGTKVFQGWAWEFASFMFTLVVFLWAAIIIQVANNAMAQEIAEYKYVASEWEVEEKPAQDAPDRTISLPA
jgi:hypothetical protein